MIWLPELLAKLKLGILTVEQNPDQPTEDRVFKVQA
jgi:hypothetical protein